MTLLCWLILPFLWASPGDSSGASIGASLETSSGAGIEAGIGANVGVSIGNSLEVEKVYFQLPEDLPSCSLLKHREKARQIQWQELQQLSLIHI